MYAPPALRSFRTAVVSSLNMMHAEDAGVAQTSHSMSATRSNSPPSGCGPSLCKLRFAPWDTTCGSAARYAERLRLSDAATFYTTCFPPREGCAFTRRKTITFRRFRPERQSLSEKQGAKPPGTSANSDSFGARSGARRRGLEAAPEEVREPPEHAGGRRRAPRLNVSGRWASNRGSQRRTAWRTPRSAASSRTSWPRRRRCVQSAHPRGAAQGRRSRCASPRRPTR